ncbi:MAG TPA: PxKF domain-containing protein [Mycobacteriales bacterium]|nr:PxKF domain-containing protein [Mycobacteriales bacterium]
MAARQAARSSYVSRRRVAGVVLATCAVLVSGAQTALASSVISASFTGGTGTVSVGGTLYAKSGGALTLTVNTSSDTQCVDVAGTYAAHQQSATPKSTWTFSFTAGAGDGSQTVTASASPGFNTQNKCTGNAGTSSASFVLDNTGPQVTATVSPTPNAAGWNKSNASITWSATDAGSGVASGPTPATDSQSGNTSGVTKSSTATDRLGNVGNGSVTVKVDKTAPSITGSRAPAANTNGWNNTDVTASFTCSDSPSGIKTCSGPTTLTSSAANQSVTGNAVDNADNSASATVGGINIDKVGPTLSGAPTTSPNSAGWYNSDVTVHWSCTDTLSGLNGSCPSDSTIGTEGIGLTASTSVSDKAGNTTSATSSPAVKIDKTPPSTTISSVSNNWVNTDVPVTLTPSDDRSGVASTTYTIDGGTPQSGTSFTLTTEGDHTLTYFSTDNAGNSETTHTVHVKIDKTAPTIGHVFDPSGYTEGTWTNAPKVTVDFQCADQAGLSGVATCGPDVDVTAEGSHVITGSTTDNAGNGPINDSATVNIDRTAPTVTPTADRDPVAGWYNADVTVTYSCADALSGIADCPAPDVLHEGAGQTATGTAHDRAGNAGTGSLTGINIDETAPALDGATTAAPNSAGWYSGDVTVHWTCADLLSGLVGDCSTDSTVTGEGDDLSASQTVHDLAGNETTKTVSGIKIDRTAPTTSASVPDPLATGWYAGDVEVTLTTGPDLSGVAATYYEIDNGSPQLYAGPFPDTLRGTHTITYWSVDNAGNVEDASIPGHVITLKIDGTPPTIIASPLPAANANGWNNSPVTVSFTCGDAESGVAACNPPVTLSNEGAGQTAHGDALDNAGNAGSTDVNGINIDLTPPTLSGAATSNPNAFGWYKGDVTIHWTASDALSDIDRSSVPGDSTITGEGDNLGAGPVSVFDKAGNETTKTVSGFKIDRTPPTISGATVNDDGTARHPNDTGWFNSAVRVRFACDDKMSGIQECAADQLLTQDGADQSATAGATDKADNAASTTVTGINIDSQAPTSSGTAPCGSTSWCTGSTVPVHLAAADQSGLSGVKEIDYSLDGKQTWHTFAGDDTTVDVPLASTSSTASIDFYAVDTAGNVEESHGLSLKYDNVAPTVTHVLSPAANANGWNNAAATVHFDATDDLNGSGVDPTSVTPDSTYTAETSGTAVAGQASDVAGNVGYDSVTVRIDKTPPSISAAPTTSANSSGWYTGPVTVHFTCGDPGTVASGVATCPADVVLSTDGSGQHASGTAYDNAGNQASAEVTGINIDSTNPTITAVGVADGAIFTLGDPSVPASPFSCTATDGGSGVASCSVVVTGGQPNGVGTFSFTATAKDVAGNTTTQTGSYKVIYRWDGFRQPINDTAHQIGTSTSVFKGGSTVPAKFQVKTASGTVVRTNTSPLWLTPAKGSPMTAAVDESVYSDPATNGTSYSWDSTSQQYIYNWSTKGLNSGFFYRVGVTLDDGQTYYVNLGLR